MTASMTPMCLFCKRFRPDADTLVCDAFPGGIPDNILDSVADHRQPYEGDDGKRFEPVSAEGAAYAERLFGETPSQSATFAMHDVTTERRIPKGAQHGGEWVATTVTTIAPTEIEPGHYKSVAQAQDAMTARFPGTRFNFEGLDLDNVNDTTVGLAEMGARYPQVMKFLAFVGVDPNWEPEWVGHWRNAYAVTSATSGEAKARSMAINLNPAFFAPKGLINQKVADDVKKHWHPANARGARYIILHEFGHVLDHWFRDTKEGDRYWGKWVKVSSFRSYPGFAAYGQTDRFEEVAEVFAAVSIGPENGGAVGDSDGMGSTMIGVLDGIFPRPKGAA